MIHDKEKWTPTTKLGIEVFNEKNEILNILIQYLSTIGPKEIEQSD